jgi:WD40 repeat protein
MYRGAISVGLYDSAICMGIAMKPRYVLQAVLPLVLILGGIWGYVNLIQPGHKVNQPFADEPPAIPAGQPVPAVLEANPRLLAVAARIGNAPTASIVFCASADGRFYATADTAIYTQGKRYPMRLWDAKTGNQLRMIDGNMVAVLAAAFSPDGTVLATGGMDDTLRLWDTATGQQMSQHRHRGHVYAIAWSKDGKFIATGSDDVKLWNVKQGQVVRDFQRPPPKPKQYELFMHVALSPDGKLVASQSDVLIRVWDIASGEQRLAIEKTVVSGFGDWRLERVFSFSADSKRLLATIMDERQLRAWDTTTGQVLDEPALKGVSGRQAISSDSRWLAWSNYGPIQVRDLALGKNIGVFPAHAVTSMAFSGDAKRLLVTSLRSDLLEYDAGTGKVTNTFIEAFQRIIGLASGSKGQVIALTTEWHEWTAANLPRPLQLRDWEVGTARELKRTDLVLQGRERPVQLSSDGKLLLTVDHANIIRVWNAVEAKPLATIDANWDALRQSSSHRFSPDGKKIVGLTSKAVHRSEDGEFVSSIAIWDVVTGKLTDHVKCSMTDTVAFTIDGERVIAGPSIQSDARLDGKLRVWDPKTGKIVKVIALPMEISELHGSTPINAKVELVTHIEPSPDGKWLAVVEEVLTPVNPRRGEGPPPWPQKPRWYVKIVDLATGLEKAVLPAGGPEREGAGLPYGLPNMPPVAWSGNSKWVATGHDANVAVCDVTTWTIKRSTQGHQKPATALHWLENDQLVSASADGTIILWDPAKGP